MRNIAARAFAYASMITLVACGGGSAGTGSSSVPAASVLSPGMDFSTALSKGLIAPACPAAATGHARCLAYYVTASVVPHQDNTASTGLRLVKDNSNGSSASDTVNNRKPLAGGITPAQLQAAYGLTSMSASLGAGRVVAVVEIGDNPTLEHDLSVFRTTYSLSSCTYANGCLRKIAQDGSTRYPGVITTTAAWPFESGLDAQTVSAICPKCDILVVESNSDAMTDIAAAENEAVAAGAFAVSNSYSADENGTQYASLASAYNHPGVAITVASGDQSFSAGPQVPASFNTVVAVGGTTLVTASNARGWTDTVWSGTGSGCSAMVAKPAWQTDKGCTMRTIGDVSFDADPATLIQSYGSTPVFGAATGWGWNMGGGTSYGAPAIAAIYALSGTTINNASSLYTNASQLIDIVGGTNDSVDRSGACIPAVGGTQGPIADAEQRRTFSGSDWPAYLCTGVVGYDAPSGNGVPYGPLPPAAPSPSPTPTCAGEGSGGTPNPHPTQDTQSSNGCSS